MFFEDYKQGASIAADLVNTVGSISGTDFLAERGALQTFLSEHDISGRPTARDMRRLQDLRERLRPIFQATDDNVRLEMMNELLRDTPASPQVIANGDAPRIGMVPIGGAVSDRIAVAAVVGLATALTELGLDRVGLCEADDCEDVYADTSKNGSRRFCSQSCGTRTHVAAFRARTREAD